MEHLLKWLKKYPAVSCEIRWDAVVYVWILKFKHQNTDTKQWNATSFDKEIIGSILLRVERQYLYGDLG